MDINEFPQHDNYHEKLCSVLFLNTTYSIIFYEESYVFFTGHEDGMELRNTLYRLLFLKGTFMESIIAAVITGGLALAGVIITNINSNRKIESKLMVAQGITDTKIDNLTEEVKRHNGFADRVPRIETRLDNIEKRMDRLENDNK